MTTTPDTTPAAVEAMCVRLLAGDLCTVELAPEAAAMLREVARERDGWQGTLRYCETQWAEERGFMIRRYTAAEAEAAALREALRGAADLIEQYVEFLHRMPSRYLEEHPYIPTVEDVRDRLRDALKETSDGL